MILPINLLRKNSIKWKKGGQFKICYKGEKKAKSLREKGEKRWLKIRQISGKVFEIHMLGLCCESVRAKMPISRIVREVCRLSNGCGQ